MRRMRGNRQQHKAFFQKDYVLDNGANYSILAAALTPASATYLNVRGFKTFTMWLSVPTASIINGSELGIAVLNRPDDSTTVTATYLALKTNLNLLGDFKTNIANNLIKDYTIAFGGNALNYTGYSFSNFVPYIRTTLDTFTVLYWNITAIT